MILKNMLLRLPLILKKPLFKRMAKTFFRNFIIILFSVFVPITTLLALFFQNITQALNSFGIFGFTILVFFSAIISLLIVIGKLLANVNAYEESDVTKRFFNSTKEYLRELLLKNENSDVIRIGSSLSRSLWISGDYQNRIEIGNIVFEAAAIKMDEFTKGKTLIDDIGWTYVMLSDEKKAIENITNGIEHLKKADKPYWVAKGYRHLFNLRLIISKEIAENDESIANAKSYLEKIENRDDKNEMEAGIKYAEVELLILKNELKTAIVECKNIFRIYIDHNDIERASKTYSQLGKIYYLLSDYSKSINAFWDGVGLANKSRRIDELIKCYMGLAVCHYSQGNIEQFKEYKKQVINLHTNNIRIVFWDEISNIFKGIRA